MQLIVTDVMCVLNDTTLLMNNMNKTIVSKYGLLTMWLCWLGSDWCISGSFGGVTRSQLIKWNFLLLLTNKRLDPWIYVSIIFW